MTFGDADRIVPVIVDLVEPIVTVIEFAEVRQQSIAELPVNWDPSTEPGRACCD
jgi:hypothetical protein